MRHSGMSMASARLVQWLCKAFDTSQIASFEKFLALIKIRVSYGGSFLSFLCLAENF